MKPVQWEADLKSSLMSIADELELAARKLRRVALLRMSREEAQRRIEDALRIMHQSYVSVRAREENLV
jgi:hypothetical protein